MISSIWLEAFSWSIKPSLGAGPTLPDLHAELERHAVEFKQELALELCEERRLTWLYLGACSIEKKKKQHIQLGKINKTHYLYEQTGWLECAAWLLVSQKM